MAPLASGRVVRQPCDATRSLSPSPRARSTTHGVRYVDVNVCPTRRRAEIVPVGLHNSILRSLPLPLVSGLRLSRATAIVEPSTRKSAMPMIQHHLLI